MSKKGFKRMLCVLVVALMMVSLLAACGSSSSSTAATTAAASTVAATAAATTAAVAPAEKAPADYSGNVSMWYWDKASEDKIVGEFNKVYTNIKVDVVAVGYDDYVNKVQTSIAAGTEISDILVAEMGFRGRLMKMDVLENLEAAPYNLDKTKFLDYVPAIASYNGNVVGVDTAINSAGLAYKAALAKQYLGTDDPAELEKLLPTWDAFVAKGKEVQAKSGGKVFLVSCWADLQEYFNNFGTDPYTADNKATPFALDTRATERYNLLTAMLAGKTVDKSIPDHYTPADNASFTKDNHIFYNSATWGVNYVLKANDPKSVGR